MIDIYRPVPGAACQRCEKNDCHGHYETELPQSNNAAPVPLIRIAEELESNDDFDTRRFAEIGRECLVSPNTVEIYVNHLKQIKVNRMKGVEKARKTRENKKLQS